MHIARTLLSCSLLLLMGTAANAAAKTSSGTVELKLTNQRVEGRVVARDDVRCRIIERTGSLREVKLSEVKSFKQVSPKFSPLSPMALSSELIRELGKDFETATTRHYVVVAPKGKAKDYVELFENVYRTFQMHFSVRGFDVTEPEFPLVAIVMPHREAFLKYAKSEGANAAQWGGYYSPSTNRAVLYETGAGRSSANRERSTRTRLLNSSIWDEPSENNADLFGAPRQFKSIDSDQRDTMIHECTHQVAFNVGLHDRVGENPKWIVEGLATVFEAPGIRNSTASTQLGNRVNPDRLAHFKQYLKDRRPKDSLHSTLASDELFKTAMPDAYAEAWALSFFLVETRPRKYSDLLNAYATRDSEQKLTSDERLALFRSKISDNLRLFEAEFIRFYDKLK